MGYHPWGRKESDMTEQACINTSILGVTWRGVSSQLLSCSDSPWRGGELPLHRTCPASVRIADQPREGKGEIGSQASW